MKTYMNFCAYLDCHHGTSRPQAVDGGDGLPDMEDSCEYIE
jgi:hypothetical protein